LIGSSRRLLLGGTQFYQRPIRIKIRVVPARKGPFNWAAFSSASIATMHGTLSRPRLCEKKAASSR
jgi:hypothetical protein